MGGSSSELRPRRGEELQAIVQAERTGKPFLVYRDETDALQIVVPHGPFTIGRDPAANLVFAWDDQVSGVHAELTQLAGALTLVDDGLSRNGSYVNGERVRGRRRLHDGDVMRFGRTDVMFRKPRVSIAPTSAGEAFIAAPTVSERQREVLAALCRPLASGGVSAAPATNQQIADELHLSVAAVKLHLRALAEKFNLKELPQNEKRLALAALARASGLAMEG